MGTPDYAEKTSNTKQGSQADLSDSTSFAQPANAYDPAWAKSTRNAESANPWVLTDASTIEIQGHGTNQMVWWQKWITVKSSPVMVAHTAPRVSVTLAKGGPLRLGHAPTLLPLESEGDQLGDPQYRTSLEFTPLKHGTHIDQLVIRFIDSGHETRINVLCYSEDSLRGMVGTKEPPQPTPTVAPAPKEHPGGPITKLMTRHDFGEQVVGSHEAKQVFPVANNREASATTSIALEGEGFEFLNGNRSYHLPSVHHMTAADAEQLGRESPSIVFAPKSPKHHAASLLVGVRWQDGVEATTRVQLEGRARTMDQAPERADVLAPDPANAAMRSEQEAKNKLAAERKRPPVSVPEIDLPEGLARTADIMIDKVKDKQLAGLQAVKDEIGSYEKLVETAEPSIWVDLAVWALSAATAGIAAKVAEKIPGLFASATKNVLWVHNVHDEVGALLLTSPAKVSVFVTDSVKEGIKLRGKDAIATALRPKPTNANAPRHEREGGGGEHSSNAKANFFTKQHDIIGEQATANRLVISDQLTALRPHITTNPVTHHAVIGVMTAIAESFKATAPQAEDIQTASTAPQWTALVARANLGGERVATANEASKGLTGNESAAKTQQLRSGHEDRPKAVDGVLEIYLASSDPPAKVTRAKMHGVSRDIVGRLQAMSLVDQPIVIRLQLGASQRPTIVTRDEVGRLHVTGDYHGITKWSPSSSQRGSEADAIAGAKILVETVLSEPLKVPIEHNDISPKSGIKGAQ